MQNMIFLLLFILGLVSCDRAGDASQTFTCVVRCNYITYHLTNAEYHNFGDIIEGTLSNGNIIAIPIDTCSIEHIK